MLRKSVFKVKECIYSSADGSMYLISLISVLSFLYGLQSYLKRKKASKYIVSIAIELDIEL